MDGQGTLQLASGAMLVAVAASLAASVGYVVFAFDAPPPAAMVVGSHDEFQDQWTALGRVSPEHELTWSASSPGVRYAVDGEVGSESPELSTQAHAMPVGRVYAFCADGDDVVAAWSFSMHSGPHHVGAVTFSAIMPC